MFVKHLPNFVVNNIYLCSNSFERSWDICTGIKKYFFYSSFYKKGVNVIAVFMDHAYSISQVLYADTVMN